MGTTIPEVSLEERLIQFGHYMGTTSSVGCLDESLIQFVASYGDSKLRRKSTKESHKIYGILLRQIYYKVVKKSVSYNLLHYMGPTNSESLLEERLIKFVASNGD